MNVTAADPDVPTLGERLTDLAAALADSPVPKDWTIGRTLSDALATLDALEREQAEAQTNFVIERKRANNLERDLAAVRADLDEAQRKLVRREGWFKQSVEAQNRATRFEADLAEAREALRRVIEINDRERMGDDTLSGLEWGEVINAARRLASEVGEETLTEPGAGQDSRSCLPDSAATGSGSVSAAPSVRGGKEQRQ